MVRQRKRGRGREKENTIVSIVDTNIGVGIVVGRAFVIMGSRNISARNVMEGHLCPWEAEIVP